MLIGRTDDPQNPRRVAAFEVTYPFGCGSRNPSGPAAVLPRQQAGHTNAIVPDQIFLKYPLASKGPSTHALRLLVGEAMGYAVLTHATCSVRLHALDKRLGSLLSLYLKLVRHLVLTAISGADVSALRWMK
jgi:hypothetical protein